MSEPYQPELQAAVDAAERATAIDDRAAVALAGSFYKDFNTGGTVTTFGPGWFELLRVSPAGGYDGIAFYHPTSRSLVLLNRGTEGFKSLPDWMQNVGAALFGDPGPQLDSALALLRDGFDRAPAGGVDQILICGHSLGGALSDAQGALAASALEKAGKTCPPVRVVGAASAGFARAVRTYAAANGLTPDPSAKTFITHYVRKSDPVPNHLRRTVFGREVSIASVFETRNLAPPGPHAVGREWRVVEDLLKQHLRTLYFQFLDAPGTSHIWYSDGAKTFEARAGDRPKWMTRQRRPKDW